MIDAHVTLKHMTMVIVVFEQHFTTITRLKVIETDIANQISFKVGTLSITHNMKIVVDVPFNL